MSGPCDATQLTVYGPVANGQGPARRLSATFGETGTGEEPTLAIYPDLPRDRELHLILESIPVETVPDVLECSGGSEAAGFEVPPIQTSTITDGDILETPAAALEALLATPDAERWPKTGYFELLEPDGAITYGNPIDDYSSDPRPENGLVIAVSVIPVDGGWTVDGWATSGC